MVLQWSWDLLLWVPTFILSGSLLKLLDRASDRLKLQKEITKSFLTVAYIGALVCSLLFLWASSVSHHFATLYTGIIFGVLFAGKVDSPFFLLGTIVYVVGLFFIIFNWPIFAFWNVVVILVLSAVDELGHNIIEKNSKSILNTALLAFMFKYRFFLKAGVLLLFLIGWLDGVAVVGLWVFDLAYVVTDFLLVTR